MYVVSRSYCEEERPVLVKILHNGVTWGPAHSEWTIRLGSDRMHTGHRCIITELPASTLTVPASLVYLWTTRSWLSPVGDAGRHVTSFSFQHVVLQPLQSKVTDPTLLSVGDVGVLRFLRT